MVGKVPKEERGGTLEGRGEGQSPREVSGRARPSVFFDSATYAKRRGEVPAWIRGQKKRFPHRTAGSEPPDCVKDRRAAAASDLAPSVAALSLLFWDVLRFL